jgi:NAD(P)H-hydrate epimerase
MFSEPTAYLTRAQSRAVDDIAIREFGMSGLVLMENAGRECASFLFRFRKSSPKHRDWPIVICCGKGNNGGDGFVIARTLLNWGVEPAVFLWSSSNEISGDAAANFAILNKMEANIVELGGANWDRALAAVPRGEVIVVDALLGTGAQGDPRPPYDQAIGWINSLCGLVIAIDLPSGLDADSGLPSGNTVRADYTLTFVAKKTGFAALGAEKHLGTVSVIDIGVPRAVIERAATLE